jgi:hypothetical protein
MIDALLDLVFTVVVEAIKAIWRHDFPDSPNDPERSERVAVATLDSPSHPLWDHEVDGQ